MISHQNSGSFFRRLFGVSSLFSSAGLLRRRDKGDLVGDSDKEGKAESEVPAGKACNIDDGDEVSGSTAALSNTFVDEALRFLRFSDFLENDLRWWSSGFTNDILTVGRFEGSLMVEYSYDFLIRV